jgi:hypothetical protein
VAKIFLFLILISDFSKAPQKIRPERSSPKLVPEQAGIQYQFLKPTLFAPKQQGDLNYTNFIHLTKRIIVKYLFFSSFLASSFNL